MPESVAVIGCGPGGMFFCHAMEAKRRELEGNPEALATLPQVTAFERASGPGGVWRSERNNHSTDDTAVGGGIAEEKKEAEVVTESNHNTQMVSRVGKQTGEVASRAVAHQGACLLTQLPSVLIVV
jgi:hypothetical protein